MKYEFNVDPKVLYLFIDNLTEEKYEEYIDNLPRTLATLVEGSSHYIKE